jgi:hypothetical protein
MKKEKIKTLWNAIFKIFTTRNTKKICINLYYLCAKNRNS